MGVIFGGSVLYFLSERGFGGIYRITTFVVGLLRGREPIFLGGRFLRGFFEIRNF